MDILIRKSQRSSPFKTLLITALIFVCAGFMSPAGSVPTMVIPQISLVMASPVHPQVLILLGNSESMDGTLSGAIMTGSGSLPTALNSLNASSSPVNYTVPAGFVPPVQAAVLGVAPYTVTQGSNLVDNGPSRLNVAKAGIQAIITSYMQSTDFGLMTYSVSSVGVYGTWVYYISPAASNFVFTSIPVAGNRYVNNPCFGYLLASTTVASNCAQVATQFSSVLLNTSLYMQIGASSDDANINDVLYAGSSIPGVFLTYTGPTPATPYPPNFSLLNYNNGSIVVTYGRTVPNIGAFGLSPTNAGYVPFSPQTLFAKRGFGYAGSQSATTGNLLVPMTSAGISPTTTTINNAVNLFLPYLKPETNSTSTTEIKGSATQAPTAGLLTRANTYFSTLGITSGSCPQKKYVILISDGLPTADLNGKFWPPLGSAAAIGYGVTATFNADGSLNTTNDQALTDAIDTIKTLKNNGIATYIIGLGAGVDPTANPIAAATLTAMAVAGGTVNYYPATNPTTLVNSLNSVLISIQNGSFSTSAAAVGSTILNNMAVEYLANFVSSDVPYQDWTGNLYEIALDSSSGAPTGSIIWSAQSLLDAKVAGTGWSTRIIATWNPLLNIGIPFEWLSINLLQQLLLQPFDLLGINRIQYLRGNTALEQRNGGPYRNRSHILGDIINSQTLYVGPPNAQYTSTSYASFVTAQASRTPLLFVGANDGMLHAFNATTGAEVFAFIPNAVFANLFNLTTPQYNLSHQFFVDGSPRSGDVQFSNGSWHTIVVGGENAGGKSIYALDVTSSANYSSQINLANSILWEFTDGDMGLSYSIPAIAEIGSNTSNPLTFAVFFGNGYNNPNNTSVIYAVNPQTGALLAKIDLCTIVPTACNATLPQGLSSVAVGNLDGIQGHPVTVVYAGDLQGNLWAMDVTDPSPANWTARLLFKAVDSTGAAQAITTPPVVTLNPNYPRYQGLFVMFGTGRLLTSSDLSDTQTQSIYGVWDKPSAATTFGRSNLQSQTLTLIAPATSGLSQNVLTVTANTINWITSVGWYLDLPTPGQRLITNPTIFSGAFIATLNTPPLSSCGIGFSSTLLELNYLTGGAFATAHIDINGDGGLNTQDQINGGYAAGISLSNSYANSPTLIGPNQNGNIVILITQSNGTQSVIINPNTTSRRSGWWQLQ